MIYSFSILKQKLTYNFQVIQIYGTQLNLNINFVTQNSFLHSII